jgi:hypothetical protein
MSTLENLARIIGLHSQGTEAGKLGSTQETAGEGEGSTGVGVVPEVEAVQNLAKDYCALLV